MVQRKGVIIGRQKYFFCIHFLSLIQWSMAIIYMHVRAHYAHICKKIENKMALKKYFFLNNDTLLHIPHLHM